MGTSGPGSQFAYFFTFVSSTGLNQSVGSGEERTVASARRDVVSCLFPATVVGKGQPNGSGCSDCRCRSPGLQCDGRRASLERHSRDTASDEERGDDGGGEHEGCCVRVTEGGRGRGNDERLREVI